MWWFNGKRIFGEINAKLDGLRALILDGRRHMDDQVKKLLDAMNAETNDIGARIDALNAKLAAAPGTDPEVLAGLTALSARLQGLAADPSNPIPAPAPAPAPTAPTT